MEFVKNKLAIFLGLRRYFGANELHKIILPRITLKRTWYNHKYLTIEVLRILAKSLCD